ncbi:glycosyltransferase family 4 protein [Microbulbifer celer]|uniref:Glycosyltransferase family 4 protein n=1 Tax=Microbulbifer celer TaxID=435905 RepID=A0ABW3U663_9GAMM|nr:glycosyltransferase family 4 protein [Microbulbifer celer]UFN57871.1 glycosyltransferase family 4 protein [Microbulbifer celer]
MHILIPVYFNAPLGGLHENVISSSRFMVSKKHRVTVVCKSGPFGDRLLAEGIGVIEADFSLPSFSSVFFAIKALHAEHPIDLVHAHPFASRQLGMMAAQVLGLPCVVTMHGKYVDALPDTIGQLDGVFTVSEGIRQYLIQEGGVAAPEKLHVIPNTPDVQLFKPARRSAKAGRKVTISLVTRLDHDKAFMLEIFYKAVAHAAERYSGRIHWQVVGQGTLQEELTQCVEQLRGDNSVSFTGWLEGEALRDAYQQSDAVIVPGRCALEAMSCGVPAIALGSKGYSGLVAPDTWQQAVYTNFGGVGDKADGYSAGAVERDLDTLMTSARNRRRLGLFGRRITQQLFNPNKAHLHLLGFYRLVVEAHKADPRAPVPRSEFLELRLRGLDVARQRPDLLVLGHRCERPETLSFAWYLFRDGEVVEKFMYRPEPQREISLPGPGRYEVRCFVQDEHKRRVSFIGAEVVLP